MKRAELDALLAAKKKLVRGVKFAGINLQKPTRVDFSKTTLDDCDLSKADVRGVSFAGATLKNTWTAATKFADCDFSGATIHELSGPAPGAKFVGARIKAGIESVDLQKADFTNAQASAACFMSADLRGAIFRGAKLAKADFNGAKLQGADFTGADVRGADFEDAELKGVIGLKGVEGADDSETGVWSTTSTLGGPLIAMCASLAKQWNGDEDYGRACEAEDKRVVAGWVESGSVTVGKSRALVLEGEMDTGMIAVDDGAVLVRGGEFGDRSEVEAAVKKALAQKKGWLAHDEKLQITSGKLFLFDSVANGAAKVEDITCEYDALSLDLPKGTYSMRVWGTQEKSGPVVFIHLQSQK